LAGLTAVNGVLYGVTFDGGANNYGAVYKITTSGKETLLHSFDLADDGAYPWMGSLIDVRGALYGTTWLGGIGGQGTVFKITTSGNESIVYGFTGRADGGAPIGGLVELGGALYGTTSRGGGASSSGTVFKVTLSGKLTTLHTFDGPDGSDSFASMVNLNHILYGTTVEGGSSHIGTVFSIAP
jgi:uncharacterized repeat protein (TIGR03803 family)